MVHDKVVKVFFLLSNEVLPKTIQVDLNDTKDCININNSNYN